MTPGDLIMFIEGWKASNGTSEPDAMTSDRFAELVEKYG